MDKAQPNKKKNSRNNQRRRQHQHGHRLNLDLLNQIERDMYESNVRELKRSESMDRGKFRVKVFNKEDHVLRLAKRQIVMRRKTSVPGKLDFVRFEKEKKPASMKDESSREWARHVWSEWFDQVIPNLDGTFKDDTQLFGQEAADDTLVKLNFLKVDSGVNNKEMRENNEMGGGEEETIATDDDDETNADKRLATSPTPYRQYEQVDMDLDKEELNLEMIKLIEAEIQVLDTRIEAKLNSFDLTRRATLYRKLGFLKKALDDLNLAISMEANFVDAYWQRHLVYLVHDRKADALEDLNLILKLKRTHAGAYLSR
jgi:hypothetical protein